AADSSGNSSIEPMTSLRCLRFPRGPGSRHLNSHTSGLDCLTVRMTLPFCIFDSFRRVSNMDFDCHCWPIKHKILVAGVIGTQLDQEQQRLPLCRSDSCA